MKSFVIPTFISILLLLIACENVDLNKVSKEDINKVIVCPDKYIRFGASCCLDKNSNNICDIDENQQEEQPTEGCKDECSTNTCSGLDYTECLMKSDGCKDKVVKGKVIGNCGVECTTHNDCAYNEVCGSFKCKLIGSPEEEDENCQDECTYDTCAGYEVIKCQLKSNGCRYKENMGIVLGKCNVECEKDSDCSSGEECDDYKCKKIECNDECNEGDIGCLGNYTLCYCYLGEDGCFHKLCSEECREGETCEEGRCCTKFIMGCGQDTECRPKSMRADWCVGEDIYTEDRLVYCINPNTTESYCKRCVTNKKVGHCEGCVDGGCPVLN